MKHIVALTEINSQQSCEETRWLNIVNSVMRRPISGSKLKS